MENQDSTMRLPAFDGTRRDDVEKDRFTCQAIWSEKRITDETSKIVHLETTFRDRALTWYTKYKVIVSVGQMEVPHRDKERSHERILET